MNTLNTIFIELLSEEAQKEDDVFASTVDREETHLQELSNKGNLKYITFKDSKLGCNDFIYNYYIIL